MSPTSTLYSGANTDTLSFGYTTAQNRHTWQFKCIVSNASESKETVAVRTVKATRYIINNVIYELQNNEMVVTGYEAELTSYVVEDTVDGYAVTKIGESAFEGQTMLVSIDLPDSITVIGRRAFAGCTSLKEMK